VGHRLWYTRLIGKLGSGVGGGSGYKYFPSAADGQRAGRAYSCAGQGTRVKIAEKNVKRVQETYRRKKNNRDPRSPAHDCVIYENISQSHWQKDKVSKILPALLLRTTPTTKRMINVLLSWCSIAYVIQFSLIFFFFCLSVLYCTERIRRVSWRSNSVDFGYDVRSCRITVRPQAADGVSHHCVRRIPPFPVRPRVAFPFFLAVPRVVPLLPTGPRVPLPLRQPIHRVSPPQPLQLPTPVPPSLPRQCLLFIGQPRRRHSPTPPPPPTRTRTHAHNRMFSLNRNWLQKVNKCSLYKTTTITWHR
jgi:hypothetical protein